MARGVSKGFIRILDGEQRSARVRVTVIGILSILLLGPAFLLAPPEGVLVHLVALLAGLGIGLIAATVTYGRTYQRGLVALWKEWMEAAAGSETLAECHRKVMGRSGRHLPWVYAAMLTVFWAAEVGLIVMALGNRTTPAATPVIAANALVLGAVTGYGIKAIRWSRDFASATRQMIAAGEVGLWGTR